MHRKALNLFLNICRLNTKDHYTLYIINLLLLLLLISNFYARN